jgi:hypothetical protein
MSSPVTTEIAFHDIKGLEAKTYNTTGTPLVLTIETNYGNAEIILYLDNQLLADRLTLAINLHLQGTPLTAETAAYAAANYFYNGGQR